MKQKFFLERLDNLESNFNKIQESSFFQKVRSMNKGNFVTGTISGTLGMASINFSDVYHHLSGIFWLSTGTIMLCYGALKIANEIDYNPQAKIDRDNSSEFKHNLSQISKDSSQAIFCLEQMLETGLLRRQDRQDLAKEMFEASELLKNCSSSKYKKEYDYLINSARRYDLKTIKEIFKERPIPNEEAKPQIVLTKMTTFYQPRRVA